MLKAHGFELMEFADSAKDQPVNKPQYLPKTTQDLDRSVSLCIVEHGQPPISPCHFPDLQVCHVNTGEKFFLFQFMPFHCP